jgi:PAS domain-containing protein
MTAPPSTRTRPEPVCGEWVRSNNFGADIANRPEAISEKASCQLVQDLLLHQTELTAQNDELQRIEAELGISRARYFDLYEFAPVGYCTVSDAEIVLEANLTTAKLLGVSQGDILGLPIQKFIMPCDQDIYYLHLKKLLETGLPQSCELRLLEWAVPHFGHNSWQHLQSVRTGTKFTA